MRAFLPDWTDDALQHKAGLLEVRGFLARHLGLRLRPEGGFDNGILPDACFKLRAGTTPEAVSMSRQVATSVARIIAQSVENHDPVLSFSADRIRELALSSEQGCADWVDFPGLIDAAWEIGIPVVYLPNLGVMGKKPEGMVTYVAGRPVVVLLKRNECADWQLFTLAHELGHIACGHLELQEGAAIVDEKVDEPSSNDSAPADEQEAQANAFANEVLIPSGELVLNGQWPTAPEFAAAANRLYGLAQAALKILAEESGTRSTSDVCREALARRINLGSLRDDTVEFLEKLKVV